MERAGKIVIVKLKVKKGEMCNKMLRSGRNGEKTGKINTEENQYRGKAIPGEINTVGNQYREKSIPGEMITLEKKPGKIKGKS